MLATCWPLMLHSTKLEPDRRTGNDQSANELRARVPQYATTVSSDKKPPSPQAVQTIDELTL